MRWKICRSRSICLQKHCRRHWILKKILAIAEGAEELSGKMPEALRKVTESEAAAKVRAAKPILAVAKDEAFCFFYRDNLELLASLGAKIEYFSPLSDAEPPKNTDGLLFCGGYPELHAEELSENQTMRTKIRDNIRQGMPVLAECGGYMYLSESMEDMDGNVYPMVQAVPGNVYRTKKLGRFGYITLTPNTKDTFRNGGNPVRGHEFHYFVQHRLRKCMACGKTAAEAELGMHSCDKTDDGGIPASLLYGKSAPRTGISGAVCLLPERTGENKMKTALAALIVGYGFGPAAWRSLLFVSSDPCDRKSHCPAGKWLRKVFPKTPKGELAGGVFLVILVCLAGYGVPALLLFAAFKIHPVIGFLLEVLWCWQIPATKCLKDESMKVYQKLKENDLPGARYAISMIVGRDTENLSETGVTKAAVETIAENTSDGVIAPLLFLAIGGPALAFCRC